MGFEKLAIQKLTILWRIFFGIPMIAFGVQYFIYLSFVTRVFPKLPAWIPGADFLSAIFGVFLIAAGIAIIIGKAARPIALVLGAAFLFWLVLFHPPLLIADPGNGGLWASAGKALGLAGGSFLVAASLSEKSARPAGLSQVGSNRVGSKWFGIILKGLERFIPVAPHFLSIFLVLCGVLHFIYVEFVMSLVPAWIPGHLFWTYFSAVALIAGGIGISTGPTSRPAAALSGLMIFLWVILLHIPRAVAAPHDTIETNAVFEALAFSGTAFLVAAVPSRRA